MNIDQKLMDEFNELAKAMKFINRMYEAYDPDADLSLEDMSESMQLRSQAQYAGPQVADSVYLASATFKMDPDFVPEDEDMTKSFVLSLIWELNAVNNALNYDFDRFGIEGFKEAVVNDPEIADVAETFEKRGFQNLLRIVR